jgi:hypothetical protein
MSFDPAHQMKRDLWESAGDEAERGLPKGITDDLLAKVEKGKQVAAIMSMPGWEVIEEILFKELHFNQMIAASSDNTLDVAHTYRVGIMVGLLKRIYLLPQIADKAKKVLEKDAKRRLGHGREQRGTDGERKSRVWFGRDGKRERA